MNKKDLIVFEINEADFSFFLYGAKKYKFPKIKNFFSKKKISTYSPDKIEGFNLDPWVQWVSVHTATTSSKHQVFRLGQVLNPKILQLWDILAKKKITILLWGLFNSILRNKKNIDLFFPDPWSFTQKSYPNKFNTFLILPRYYAKNYPNINLFLILFYGFRFFTRIFFSTIFFYLIKKILLIIYIFFKTNFKIFNLYFLLDIFSLLIVSNQLKKKKSDLSIIAINCFAHYQHNHWDEKKYEYFYFWYLNLIVTECEKIQQNYSSVIIYNGFSQKKINSEYVLRSKNVSHLLKILNIVYLKTELNMTTGVTIFFESINDKVNAIKILNNISILGLNFFEVIDFYNEKKIFYKYNIIFKKKTLDLKNKSDFKVIKKNLVKKFSFEDRDLIKNILKNSVYIKTTSKHVGSGILYYKNVKTIKSINNKIKKIQNKTVGTLILNHFN
jgi:hypothetical protein